MTVSRDLKFVTVQWLWNRTTPTILAGLEQVVKKYYNRGFNITVAYMDSEFAPLKLLLLGVIINSYAAKERVPEAEQMIQVIKERVRACF